MHQTCHNIEMAEKVAKSTLTFWKKVNAKIVGALVTEQEILVVRASRTRHVCFMQSKS